MSLTFKSDVDEQELVDFLQSEYEKGTGIPVHLYSVVNAAISGYDRTLAVTDNKIGVLFFEGNGVFKSYGSGNPFPLVRTLNGCGADLECVE